jgi:MarR family transcriptional regulator, 2-MHQ and catechol-resistance regulon repressor
MTQQKLQNELTKKRPFDSPEQEAALNLVRTSDQLQIRFSRLLREYGLTPAQSNILRILRGEGQPLPILKIASRTVNGTLLETSDALAVSEALRSSVSDLRK